MVLATYPIPFDVEVNGIVLPSTVGVDANFPSYELVLEGFNVFDLLIDVEQ